MSDQPVMLITGASSGIGSAIATRAAEAHCALVLNARSTDRPEKLAASLSTDVIVQSGDVASQDDQRALLGAVTIHTTLPLLLASKGHVVLTGSVTGRVTTPASVHSATKWAVTEIGQSLRAELRGSGVRITTVQPGVVDTPFYGDGGDSDNASLAQGEQVLKAEDVARTVLWALYQPAHVDVSELVVRSVTDQL